MNTGPGPADRRERSRERVNDGHDINDRHTQTHVQVQLSRISRITKEIEKSVSNATNVLNKNNTGKYQKLAAIGTQLHGQLNLLKSTVKKLKSIPKIERFNNIPDFLFELELDITKWEAWEARLLARITEIKNEHKSYPSKFHETKPKAVKFNNSNFPSFDGTTNYMDWWAKWEQLGRVSGYDDENLGIKSKEILKGSGFFCSKAMW